MNKRSYDGSAALCAAFIAVLGFVLAACDHSTAEPWTAERLANSVYGGTNPSGAWVTITFRNDGKMIGAFSGDNTSNVWDYELGGRGCHNI
jgi:hypothetical protein